MSNDKKKYICVLPTNGYNQGQEAFLTDAEVANFNGGEPKPRFVLADEVPAADAPTEEAAPEETPTAPQDPQPEAPATPTPGGEYTPEEPKPEDTTPPAEGSTSAPETTPPATEGVE